LRSGEQETMDRRDFIGMAGMTAAGLLTGEMFGQSASRAEGPATRIVVDLGKAVGAFPHYWENTIGSDRAAIIFREQWQRDLKLTSMLTGMKSVRCHGLFNDEMGVCNGVDAAGKLNLSFLYISQVYDILLDLGVKPFVELGFMPSPLATSNNTIFFYKGNVSRPKKMEYWGELVKAFTAHCVKRYGLAEVRQWEFECWNEPNIGFWAGTKDEYFELYRQSVTAVKSVDSRIRVGGPASAQVGWIPEMIDYCWRQNLPLDFVSTHVYASDPQEVIFGRPNAYPFEQVIPKAIAQSRDQIRASKIPDLPLLLTEWSSQNPAFIAEMLKECSGLCETMSYWTFSNVFEEMGPATEFFNGHFGLIGQGGVPRPSLHAMTLAHRLGETRVAASTGPVLATKRADGSHAILAWNLVKVKGIQPMFPGYVADPAEQARKEVSGAPIELVLKLEGVGERSKVKVTMVDLVRGSALPAWSAMGKPDIPTREQLKQLVAAAALPSPEERMLNNGELQLTLPPTAVALIETGRS
jgi:xylan 1,4-beta-xylosidase